MTKKAKATGIKTWPVDDKPREKLLKKGARALSKYTNHAARPSGRCIRSLNFKERIKRIVKPKQKASRMS